MGNLLGAPITDKETHVGSTDEMEFGLSSMQGWRVHMEDAHIAEGEIYALEVIESEAEGGEPTKTKIPLPGHAFFGVFDGHGGTYAAQYTGDNLCRILAKQPLFVEYAKFCKERTAAKKDASSPEAIAELRKGIELLEGALKQAFVDTDYEIAMALRGAPHPEANQPYHEVAAPDTPAAAASDGEDHPHDEDGDIPMTPNASSSSSATNTIMAAAHQAAANHARAMDDGDSGTTACCVMVTPDCLVCANAGDSRSVYAKKPPASSTDTTSRVIPLSFDHKPDDEAEESRVRAAGGYVAGGRVEGDLAVSRGLGDFRFKYMPTVLADRLWDGSPKPNSQADETQVDAGILKPGEQKVSPIPDIIVQTRDRENDEFIIVACDGIWDVRTNPECVVEVSTLFEEGESDIGLLCEELLDTCLRLGSKDNMTALVVKFKAQTVGEGGGVLARRKQREAVLNEQEEANSQFAGDDESPATGE